MNPTTQSIDALKGRARKLGLLGLLEHWNDFQDQAWPENLIQIEEAFRSQRSLERRLQKAHLGRFKHMADFDWTWPKKIDRDILDELFSLEFMDEPANGVFVGPNGTGKTMLMLNLAYQAVLKGHTCLFTNASALLNDLAEKDSASALNRKLKALTAPRLLCIDEVGYLSYNHRHADLLFEIVSRRYGKGSILLTTNKPFAEWNEVFPNASCVVTLVDRLVHKAEIVQIDADSFRLKEARERSARKEKSRTPRKRD